MQVLIIGGTRFMGHQLCWHLALAGHAVTTVNRGTLAAVLPDSVTRLTADRKDPRQMQAVLQDKVFDAVIDFVAYDGKDAAAAVELLHNRCGHYVFISSGQTYLVLKNSPKPARESDYDGEVAPAPTNSYDYDQWLYGVGKREAEDVLENAWQQKKFPGTRLRLPMVDGERDHQRRLEGYLWRVIDGGPVLIPAEGNHPTRHVYVRAVCRAIGKILGNTSTFGKAYNLCQDETPAVSELVQIMAQKVGSPAQVQLMPESALIAAGLNPRVISPFSTLWMSYVDPAKAKRELGFSHESPSDYLDAIINCFLSHPPADKPENYKSRAVEIKLAGQL